jgi:hypothetical protein
VSKRRISPDDEKAIDDAIDAWHESGGGGVALHEFLGWTRDEYRAWVEQRDRSRNVAKMVERSMFFVWVPMLILAGVIDSISHYKGLASIGFFGIVVAFVAGVVRGVSIR